MNHLRSPFKDTAVIAPKTITRFRNSTKSVALKAVVGRKYYICVTVFEDANELLQHLSEVHATNVGYHCKECFSKFRQVIAYNRHLGRHETKERPNKCSVCQLGFSSPNQVKVHENKVHGIENNAKIRSPVTIFKSCNICDKTFRCNSKLNFHIRRVHNSQWIPICNICDKTFTAKSSLERHMLLHTQEKPFVCDLCDTYFSRSLDVKNHVRMVHESLNPHVCEECSEQFKNYHGLCKHHQIVHLNKSLPAVRFKPYHLICKLCKRPHRKSSELIEHIRQGHSNETYPYVQCPVCPKTFLSTQHLSCHKEIHTDKYTCMYCGARNATIHRLQTHVENHHNEERRYDCPICNSKLYKSASALRTHVLTHSRGKQYRCDICRRDFMRKNQLSIHRRTHTGEKPFQCEICQKRFSDGASYCKHKKRCMRLSLNSDVSV
ncbi:zinc finger protein 675-like [Topomyia yanbarensis]|uniref:zinc finger protein 675-like n=1 Tax=Topomyia yanbarensis TaxID=2498891 RepID=UPI00273C4D86|nr:zinc finger protein 675-like [Topomyia yanbarensis]XP_058836174.1 zinc finger protein 675-like [Topomyia yanbarensis]